MTEPNGSKSPGDQQSSNLFQLRLNSTGKNYILQIYRLSNFILIANTITCVIFNIYIINDLVQANIDNDLERFALPDLFYNAYIIVYNLINIISVYFYVRFTRVIRRSIELNDEHGMNHSFRYLYINAILFTISLVVSLASELFYFVIK